MRNFATGLYQLTNRVDFGHAFSIDQEGRHKNQESQWKKIFSLVQSKNYSFSDLKTLVLQLSEIEESEIKGMSL